MLIGHLKCLNIIIVFIKILSISTICFCQYGGLIPETCDLGDAAKKCENSLLQCRLFTGPADDPSTMCKCGTEFYGSCLREAGCMLHYEEFRSPYMVYLRQCVDFIMQYNCPDTLICGLNCATEGSVNRTTVKVIPFNNYGSYYLRLRLCSRVVHQEKISKYSYMDPVLCTNISDFDICNRWIPPNSYLLVALPKNTTYIEVDYCEVALDGTSKCHVSDPAPSRIFGNKYIFPSTFDVAKSTYSICTSDGDCLGSYCATNYHPHVCSPKSLRHLQLSGANYFSQPFG